MPSSSEQVVDLTIRNDLAELAVVSNSLERIGTGLGVAFKPLMQLQVALDEVACNVIEHGWPAGGAHELRVRITAHDDRIEIEIDDDGRAFDPRRQPSPEASEAGNRQRRGGVGLHLAKQLVDRLEYQRLNGRNRTVIMKRYAQQHTAN